MRSKRYEFPARVKNAAYKRSGGRCEAVGSIYGMAEGHRCPAFLGPANVEYDHWPVPAIDEGSNTLENCVACCKACHRWKTANYDIPVLAKGRRIQRANGPEEDRRKTKPIPSRPTNWPSRPIESRGFERKDRGK